MEFTQNLGQPLVNLVIPITVVDTVFTQNHMYSIGKATTRSLSHNFCGYMHRTTPKPRW